MPEIGIRYNLFNKISGYKHLCLIRDLYIEITILSEE